MSQSDSEGKYIFIGVVSVQVSATIIPLLAVSKQTHIDRVVLLHTGKQLFHDAANNAKDAISKLLPQDEMPEVLVMQIPDTDVKAIYDIFQKHMSHGHIWFNLCGGMSWQISLGTQAADLRRTTFVYSLGQVYFWRITEDWRLEEVVSEFQASLKELQACYPNLHFEPCHPPEFDYEAFLKDMTKEYDCDKVYNVKVSGIFFDMAYAWNSTICFVRTISSNNASGNKVTPEEKAIICDCLDFIETRSRSAGLHEKSVCIITDRKQVLKSLSKKGHRSYSVVFIDKDNNEYKKDIKLRMFSSADNIPTWDSFKYNSELNDAKLPDVKLDGDGLVAVAHDKLTLLETVLCAHEALPWFILFCPPGGLGFSTISDLIKERRIKLLKVIPCEIDFFGKSILGYAHALQGKKFITNITMGHKAHSFFLTILSRRFKIPIYSINRGLSQCDSIHQEVPGQCIPFHLETEKKVPDSCKVLRAVKDEHGDFWQESQYTPSDGIATLYDYFQKIDKAIVHTKGIKTNTMYTLKSIKKKLSIEIKNDGSPIGQRPIVFSIEGKDVADVEWTLSLQEGFWFEDFAAYCLMRAGLDPIYVNARKPWDYYTNLDAKPLVAFVLEMDLHFIYKMIHVIISCKSSASNDEKALTAAAEVRGSSKRFFGKRALAFLAIASLTEKYRHYVKDVPVLTVETLLNPDKLKAVIEKAYASMTTLTPSSSGPAPENP